MKKILAFVFMLAGFSLAYSAGTTHNVFDPEDVDVTTTIIHPISITNVLGDEETLPDVIKGQIHDLSPDAGLYVFEIKKEDQKNMEFSFTATEVVDGLDLISEWYWTYTNPGTTPDFFATGVHTLSSPWVWGNANDDSDPAVGGYQTVYALLKVDKLDAEHATSTGVKTFTITCSGHYVDL